MTDFQAYDLVQETTTTTGTGTLTLSGASIGFQSFAVVGDGVQCRYSIQAVDSNNNPTGDYEVGQGTYTSSGTTLSRAVVEASSNSNSPVNLTAGTKIVRLVFSATQCNTFGAAGTAHWPGAVPDPGGTVHTPYYVLGDDGAWHVASGVAIGGAVGSGTATYVLFVDASGNLGQSSGLTFNTSGQLAVNTGGTFYATIGGSNAAQYNDGSGNVVVICNGTYAAQFNDGSSNVVVICNGTCAAQFTDGSGNVVVICNGTYAIEVTGEASFAKGFFVALLASASGFAAQFNDGSGKVVVICNGTYAAQFNDGSSNVVAICNSTYAIEVTGEASFAKSVFVALLASASGFAAQFTDGTRTVSICDGINNITYGPGVPGNWASTAPTDVWVALDRIVAWINANSTALAAIGITTQP